MSTNSKIYLWIWVIVIVSGRIRISFIDGAGSVSLLKTSMNFSSIGIYQVQEHVPCKKMLLIKELSLNLSLMQTEEKKGLRVG